MIYIENKKRKIENIQAQYPNADILDITSASTAHYAQILSPFYPHGGIPVPFTPGMYATCVEAIWQGLKVFQNVDVDVEMFKNDTMKGRASSWASKRSLWTGTVELLRCAYADLPSNI